MTVARRDVLTAGLLAGGGLLLGFAVPLPRRARAGNADVAGPSPHAFIRIAPDDRITLIMPDAESGQGIWTAAATLIAEELEIGMEHLVLEPAPADAALYASPVMGEQATGGSTSTIGDWTRLREAGARARILLVQAAADRWHVDPASCRAEAGAVHHPSSGKRATYGALAADAALLPVPGKVTLKPASEWRLIGRRQQRLDTPAAKIAGHATFGIDVQVPGMQVGSVAASPVRGGRLVSIDEAAARAVPGVTRVVRLDDVVAVIGAHYWAAHQGLRAANLRWDDGANGNVDTASIRAALVAASARPGAVARDDNAAPAKIAAAHRRLEATYELPLLAHAPMEPINTTLHVRDDGADLWVGTQVPVRAQQAVATATGLRADQVRVHNHLMGGAFGRRLDVDSIEQAARIARHLDHPVKLIWSREEDMTQDMFRPAYHDLISAGLDQDGRIVGWTHKTTGSSVTARYDPGGMKNGVDPDAVESAANTPYDLPAVHVSYVQQEPRGVPTAWWRGVGPTHNVFVVESFIDECAAAAGRDPVAYRRDMLQRNPARAGGARPGRGEIRLGAARCRPGTAAVYRCNTRFSSFMAVVLEAEVTPQNEIRPAPRRRRHRLRPAG